MPTSFIHNNSKEEHVLLSTTKNNTKFKVYMTQNFFSPRLLAYIVRKRVSKLVAGENVQKLPFFVQMFTLISLQNCRHVRAVKSSQDECL